MQRTTHLAAMLMAGTFLAGPPAFAQTPGPTGPNSGAIQAPAAQMRQGQAQPSSTQAVQAQPDADTKKVLDALQALGPKPIETLSADDARDQPTMTDAVKRVAKDEKITLKPREGLKVLNMMVPGADGELKARVYTPEKSDAPLPVIVYYHGGGWVIADLDVYDASAAALARKANAVVVAVHYRQAPEDKLPAAHEDSFAAYRWVLENAAKIDGDSSRVALVGESAGGNLAVAVALMARDNKVKLPTAIVSVYPVAGVDTNTPSYKENADAKPLSKAMMEWFFKQTMPKDPTQAAQAKRLVDLVHADLKGLPPVTIVNAQIDPLRSDGDMLADKLQAAGVKVQHRVFNGVTHEFFGAAPIIAKAGEAQDYAAQQLKTAFDQAAATGSVNQQQKNGGNDAPSQPKR